MANKTEHHKKEDIGAETIDCAEDFTEYSEESLFPKMSKKQKQKQKWAHDVRWRIEEYKEKKRIKELGGFDDDDYLFN